MKNNALLTPPRTIGEHIKRERVREGLTQRQAALIIGVDMFTVLNWENGKTTPTTKDFPGIIRFLGYNPLPEPVTFAERLYYVRSSRGWTIEEAARAAGINEDTWAAWESGASTRQRRLCERVERFLATLY